MSQTYSFRELKLNDIMEKKRMIQIVRSVKGTLMAHPDNEGNSEFADRVASLEELEQSLSMSGVSKCYSQEELDNAKKMAYNKGRTDGYWEGHDNNAC